MKVLCNKFKSIFMKSILLIVSISLLLFSCSKQKRSDKKGPKMQQFVIDISNYARGIKSDFIVIPQNGSELGFNNLDPADGPNTDYLNAIDAFGIEELFYNGSALEMDERLGNLKTLSAFKPVLVSEFVNNNNNVSNAIQKNANEGFLCFTRMSNDYYYEYIPDTIPNENANDINTMNDVQNYLYLISNSQFESKQALIDAVNATNYDLILIDLFYNETPFSSSEINALKTKANGGKRLVISYMNIGSAENYRYYWQNDWKKGHPNWLKKPYEGYKDEIWVKFWKKEWQDIIYGNANSYTKKVLLAGFDGVYLDNVEAYYFLYFD